MVRRRRGDDMGGEDRARVRLYAQHDFFFFFSSPPSAICGAQHMREGARLCVREGAADLGARRQTGTARTVGLHRLPVHQPINLGENVLESRVDARRVERGGLDEGEVVRLTPQS